MMLLLGELRECLGVLWVSRFWVSSAPGVLWLFWVYVLGSCLGLVSQFFCGGCDHHCLSRVFSSSLFIWCSSCYWSAYHEWGSCVVVTLLCFCDWVGYMFFFVFSLSVCSWRWLVVVLFLFCNLLSSPCRDLSTPRSQQYGCECKCKFWRAPKIC